MVLLLLLRSCSLAAMAERFDDVCELGELSGGDDLGEPSPKRAKYTGYKYKRIGNQSGHLFLTNPITFHNNFDENGFQQHTSRFSL